MTSIEKIDLAIAQNLQYIKQYEDVVERLQKAKILLQQNPQAGEILDLIENMFTGGGISANQTQES